MNNDEYRKAVLRTESHDAKKVIPRFDNERTIRLLHAAIGINTEAGELLDTLKKHLWYGKEIDEVNLIEEVGDLCWYVEVLLDALNASMDNVRRLNIDKLKRRYPTKFTEKDALIRNLEKERKALENAKV